MSQDLSQSIADLSLVPDTRSSLQSPRSTIQIHRSDDLDDLDDLDIPPMINQETLGPAADPSDFTEEQKAQVYNEDQKKQVMLLVNKAFTLCESAVQDYIVAVSEKDHAYWGFNPIPTPYLEFKNHLDPTLSVKIGMAVVEKEHMFPPDKCRPKAIRNEMVFMLNGLNIVLPHVLHSHRMDDPDPTNKSKFERALPKYFNKNTKFMTDPNNLTACLYCGENEEFEKLRGRKPNADESKAIYRLNRHQKRIGFVLGDVDTPTLGQDGHNAVSKEETDSIGNAMTARDTIVKPVPDDAPQDIKNVDGDPL
jgi:hypothetical protein